MPNLQEKWFVVLNPVLKGGVGASVQADIQERLRQNGFDFEYQITRHCQHAIQLTHDAILHGFRKIISIGGGGTLNEVINGILHQDICSPNDIEIIHIPNGAINDWALHHGIPTDYKKWIPQIKNATLQKHDVGLAHFNIKNTETQRYFLSNAGVAFSGYMMHLIYGEVENTGVSKMDILRNAFNSLSKIKYYDLELTQDEVKHRGNYVLFHMAFVQYYGAFKLGETPSTNQGKITLLRDVGNMSIGKYILTAGRLFNNTLNKSKYIKEEQFTSLYIDASHSKYKNYIQIDGECVGTGNVLFEVKPKALKFWLPK